MNAVSSTSIAFSLDYSPDGQQLGNSASNSGHKVVAFHERQDGLAQIAQHLQGRSGIDAIPILSQDRSGEVQPGNQWLSKHTVLTHADSQASIGQSMTNDGDILLYECVFGKGSNGQLLLNRLTKLAEADVSASTDRSGSFWLWGNSAREVSTGDNEATGLSLEQYSRVLAGNPFGFTSTDEDTTSTATLVSTIFAKLSISEAGGIAVVASTGNGIWQYSTDSTSWNSMGSVSESAALLLPSSAQVRYVPDGDNGETAMLTVRTWDAPSGINLHTPFMDGYLSNTEADALEARTFRGNAFNAVSMSMTFGGEHLALQLDASGWTAELTIDQIAQLEDGTHDIVITAEDDQGNVTSLNSQAILAVHSKPTLAITTFSGLDDLHHAESHKAQRISGTSTGLEVGQEVTLRLTNASYTAEVLDDGTWSILIPSADLQLLENTPHNMTADATDKAGNAATQVSVTFNVDLTPPPTGMTIDTIEGDDIISAWDTTFNITLSGRSIGPSSSATPVTVSVGGTPFFTTTDFNGRWYVDRPASEFFPTQGNVEITASTVDGTLTTTVLVDTVAPSLNIVGLAGDNVLSAAQASTAQDITGTASATDAGQLVRVVLYAKTYSAQVSTTGNWSVSVPAADLAILPYGPHSIWARLADSAGNVTNDTFTFTRSAQSSATTQVGMTINSVNDAPILTPVAPTLTAVNDAADSGQTVVSILGTSITDVDAFAAQGIAITGLNTGNGTWQYSLDGISWIGIGSVSANSALLLRASDHVRFLPNDSNGTAASITYKAWDQSGATSGQQGAKVDTAGSGGSSAFSTLTDTAEITTIDTLPPSLSPSSSTPADNATSVAVGAPLVLHFNEWLGSVDSAKIHLHDTAAQTMVAITVAIDANGRLVITPSAALKAGTAYHLTWDADAILDVAGNAAAAVSDPGIFNFTTASSSTPPEPNTPTEPTTPSELIDGVLVSTRPGEGGSTITSIPVVTSGRNDAPNSANPGLADIAIVKAANGQSIIQVGLPTGVGLQAQGVLSGLSGTAALNELVLHIESAGGNSEQHGLARIFDSAANSAVPSYIQTLTLSTGTGFDSKTPLAIRGNALNVNGQQVIILDARAMPSGSVVQVDNIEFIAVIGNVRLIGGAGQNFAAGDNSNQWIVLGADDDVIHGGGGDDTVGSKGGNDHIYGDAGDDILFGGAGNDLLSGGSGSDRLNGGTGFDVAIQEGKRTDYTVTLDGAGIKLTHIASGVADWLVDVEQVRFETGPILTVAHSAAEEAAAFLFQQWMGRDLAQAEGAVIQTLDGLSALQVARLFALVYPQQAAGRTAKQLLDGMEAAGSIRVDVERAAAFVGDAGDNTITPTPGLAWSIDGGAGIDTIVFPATLAQTYIEANATGFTLQRMTDGAMLELVNVERLTFSDTQLALDLDGHAGQAAKLLGALGGTAFLDNKPLVGEVIRALDAGVSAQSLAQLGLQLLGAKTSLEVTQLIWTNVVGSAATPAQLQPFVNMMAQGVTGGELAVLASNLELNAVRIDLVGLTASGIEFA